MYNNEAFSRGKKRKITYIPHLLNPNNIPKLSTLFPLFSSITRGGEGFLLSAAKFSRKGRPWTSWKTHYIVRLRYHKMNKSCKIIINKILFIPRRSWHSKQPLHHQQFQRRQIRILEILHCAFHRRPWRSVTLAAWRRLF